MNRFKVNIAKEKISRLREKYSKNVNREDVNSSSESLISVKIQSSPEVEKYQQEPKTVEKQQTSTNISIATSGAKGDIVLKAHPIATSGAKDDIILKVHPESPNNIITKESKSDESDHSLKKSLSSGSVVLSEISNQFEHLHFISNSSEEDLSIVHSVNSKTDSISVKSIPSVIVPEPNTNSQNINIHVKRGNRNVEESYFKMFKITEDTSQKSLSETRLENSNLISKKEINFVSEAGDYSHDSSVMENSQYSNTDISDVKSYEKVDSISKSSQNEYLPHTVEYSSPNILEKQSLINITMVKDREEISTESDKEISNYKRDKFNNNHIDEELDMREMDKPSSDELSPRVFSVKNSKHICKKSNSINKSTNTDPVKVTLVENKSKLNHHKSMAKVKRPFSEKTEKYKQTKRGMKYDLSGKKTTKRQFIKPCSLIKQDEIGKLESNSELKQDLKSLRYMYTDDPYYNFNSIGVLPLNCDEVISQLLKNQIKLTRHFIESHHLMYLQVCQAAQLLNENYS